MKDWMEVLPDKVKLMNKHFTKGRGGRKIRYIVRQHGAVKMEERRMTWHWITMP